MLRKRTERRHQRGAVLVLAVLLLIILFGMVAFAIDLGYVALTKAQLQRAADAAAHAAALSIADRPAATADAKTLASLNDAAGEPVLLENQDVVFGMRSYDATSGNFTYAWNTATANCVKVRARRVDEQGRQQGAINLFFAPVIGTDTANVEAESIATVNPRDIVFIMDLSGSMHHDSEAWARELLNWVSGATAPGEGDGDKIWEELWEEMGLTDAGVPYPWESDFQSSDYTLDLYDRNQNPPVELPQLDGKSVNQSRDYYDSRVGNLSGSTCWVEDGKIYAKMNYDDVYDMVNDSYIYNNWDWNWRSNYADGGKASYIRAYDFIIDQQLSQVMAQGKPSLTNASARDSYRKMWRGYVSYMRGYTSGNGSSNGMEGFSNPSSSSMASSLTDLYRRPDGSRYSSTTLRNDYQALEGILNYETYVQFMMDHGVNMKVGRRDDGSSCSSSDGQYTAMSSKFYEDTGDSSNSYRWYDSNLGVYRTLSEQPCGGVAEAVMEGILEVKRQNENLPDESVKDSVAVIAFGSEPIAITAPNLWSNPYTFDYDAAVGDVAAKASQSLPNGTGNDGIAGSTNTMHGMWSSLDWVLDYGRQHTNKVVVLFTDGEANDITSSLAESISQADYDDTLVDLGSGDQNFFYSRDAYDAKNSALRAGLSMHENNVLIHSIVAGVGRDKNVTKRLSALTDGIYRDSGGNYSEYAANLVNDFRNLANHRAVSFTIESPYSAP